jgi:very-short-patch-repair endonuclease
MEPDFVLIYRGRCVLVEIDGSSHKETPAVASERTRFLTEQGTIVYRIKSARVRTDVDAIQAVTDMIKSINREITSRP